MRNRFKIMLRVLLTVALCAAMIQTGAVASWASGMSGSGITGSKGATPTHLDDTNRETTVTLSLPAVAASDEYDVVFVMDDSSSTTLASGTFVTRVTDLLDSILASGADVNVGIVKFKGLIYDAINIASGGAYSGLVKYDSTTASAIVGGIQLEKTDFTPVSNGTNIHGGLKLADKWLTEHSAVADNHKYVLLLTDGKTYVWNDQNDVATTIYAQGPNSSFNMTSPAYQIPKTGNQVANKTKISLSSNASIMADFTGFFSSHGTAFAPFLVGYSADANVGLASEYQALYDYNADPALLAELSDVTGASPYDSRSYYAYNEDNGSAELDGTPASYDVTNGLLSSNQAWNKHIAFTPTVGGYSDGASYLEFDPYEVIDNGDSTYSYDYSKPNPDFYLLHPDATQKATYLAGHLWTDMGAKYNTAILGYSSNYTGGRTNQQAFLEWMLQPTISDYAAKTTDDAALDDLFDAIENDINYLIKSGKLTDKITDDFTLVENGTDTFTVKIDGTAQTVTAEGSSKWNFGTPDAGVYPYTVEYEAGTKTITWEINVPVQNSKPVSLTYRLEIGEGATTDDYNTNVSAVLDYTAFNGNTGTYTFEVPQVDYTYEPITDVKLVKTYVGTTGYEDAGVVLTTSGLFTEDVSFTITPYKTFNREGTKTDIPAFTPGTYTISVGDGTDEITIPLPDYTPTATTGGVGDYWYKVTETAGTTAGVTYDTTTYYLHVVVIHRGASDTVGQVTLHKTAPNDDGSYTNSTSDKTEGFENEYAAGSLTVKKELTGNQADMAKTFDIKVTFTAPAGKTVRGPITYGVNTIAADWTGDKTVTVTLGRGESITFENIPSDVTYTIKESDYSAEGYDTPVYAFDNASEAGDTVPTGADWADNYASGTVSDSADTVTVTNNKTAVLDVGVVLDSAPFLILFAAGAVAAMLLLMPHGRKPEEE